MTQAATASAARLDRSQFSRLETGDGSTTIEGLGRIARALELTPEECAELLDLAAGAGVAVDEVVGG